MLNKKEKMLLSQANNILLDFCIGENKAIDAPQEREGPEPHLRVS